MSFGKQNSCFSTDLFSKQFNSFQQVTVDPESHKQLSKEVSTKLLLSAKEF